MCGRTASYGKDGKEGTAGRADAADAEATGEVSAASIHVPLPCLPPLTPAPLPAYPLPFPAYAVPWSCSCPSPLKAHWKLPAEESASEHCFALCSNGGTIAACLPS